MPEFPKRISICNIVLINYDAGLAMGGDGIIKLLEKFTYFGAVSAIALGLGSCIVKPEPASHEEFAQRAEADLDLAFADQEAVTGPITLSEAMARAIKYNLDLRLKKMESVLARKNLSAVHTEQLPRLMTSAGYNMRSNDSGGVSRSLLTGSQSLEASTSQERQRFTNDVIFAWNILDFGVSYVRAKQQANQVLLADERRRKVAQTILQDVRYAYWRAVSAEHLLTEVKGLMILARSALERVAKIEDDALQSPRQALEYQKVMLANIRQLWGLVQRLSMAKTELAALINLRPGTKFRVVVPDKLDLLELKPDLAALEKLALINRPELRQEHYQHRISLLEVRKRLLRMLPGIEFTAGQHHDSNQYLFNNDWTSASLAITWNVFKIFSGPTMIRAAEAQAEVDEKRRLTLSMAVMTQLNLAYQRYRLALREFNLSSQAASVENRLGQISLAEQEAGTGEELDLIRTSTETLVARMQRYQDYAELQNALGRVFASLGLDAAPTVEVGDVSQTAQAIEKRTSAWINELNSKEPAAAMLQQSDAGEEPGHAPVAPRQDSADAQPVDSAVSSAGNISVVDSVLTEPRQGFEAELPDGVLKLNIEAVNNAPILLQNKTLEIDEDAPAHIFTNTLLRVTDPDSTSSELTFSLSAVPELGTLLKSGIPLKIRNRFSQADINAGRISYQPGSNQVGRDGFAFAISDGSGGAIDDVQYDIYVSAVNDLPQLLRNEHMILPEDSPPQAITDMMLKVVDPDNAPVELVYRVEKAPAKGLLLKDGNPINSGDRFSQADIDIGSVMYQASANKFGSDSFIFSLFDGVDGTIGNTVFNIKIAEINDSPSVLINSRLLIDERSLATPITNTLLQVGDVDNATSEIMYELVKPPARGTLIRGGFALGVGHNFTQADIDTGSVKYQPSTRESGDDSFTFSATDGAGGIIDDVSFDITIRVVNVLPILSQNVLLELDEDASPTPISDALLEVLDGDDAASSIMYTVGKVPVKGQLQKNGINLNAGGSFTQADIDAGVILYKPARNENGPDRFVFNVSDGRGGIISNTVFTLSIRSVNDVPVLSNNKKFILNEDALATAIKNSMLQVIDEDNLADQIVFTVREAPGKGLLLKDGLAIGADHNFTQADIDAVNISYQPLKDQYGSDSFVFEASDGVGGAVGETSFHIEINPVYDAPVAIIKAGDYKVIEGKGLALEGTALNIVDVDNNSGKIVKVILSVAEGSLMINEGKNNVEVSGTSNSRILTGAISEVNALLAGNDGATVHYMTVKNPSVNTSLSFHVEDVDKSEVSMPKAMPAKPFIHKKPLPEVPPVILIDEDGPSSNSVEDTR